MLERRAIWWVLFVSVLVVACDCDNEDSPADAAGSPVDDDASPTDDDSDADDDDDVSDDDDNDDDDAADDDDDDDDATDDDDDDDDNDDNNDDDNDDDNDNDDDDYAECETFGHTFESGLFVEFAAGAEFDATTAAVDSAGGLHVIGTVLDRLYLYHWTPDGEVTGELFAARGWRPEIAIDAADCLHVAYGDRDLNHLVYARQSAPGGAWTRETFADLEAVRARLVVTPAGAAHLAFVGGDGRVVYRTNASGAWSSRILGDIGDSADSGLALAVDADGAAHVTHNYEIYYVGYAVLYWTNRGGRWVWENLRDADIDGVRALAADADGAAHLIVPGVELTYANNRGGHWTKVPVESTAGAVAVSLKLDAAGSAHLAYQDSAAGDLVYADNVGGVWSRQTVVAAGEVGAANDLVLDSAGRPLISFIDETRRAAWATKNLGAGWISRELARGCGAPGQGLRLAAAAGGGPLHVLYQPFDNENPPEGESIVHRTNVGGAWISEPVVAQSADLCFTLAMDVDGWLHAGYLDRAREMLVYKRQTGDGWSAGEDVISSGSWSDDPSLAIDDAGVAHFSLHRQGVMLYLTNGDGLWASEIADEDDRFNIGIESQIALAPDGAADIVYLVEQTGQLKRATNAAGAWAAEVVEEGVGTVGGDWPSLSLLIDAGGRRHLGYITYNRKDGCQELHYARNAGDGWQIQVVATGPNAVGSGSVMALDADDRPHFVYRSAYDLLYAKPDGDQWTMATILETGDDGDRFGLRINDDGTAEAIWSNGWLLHVLIPSTYPGRDATR